MGFKKLPFEWRDTALKIHPSYFMVWLAHYWRSDKENMVEIANAQLVEECNLGLSLVKEAKRWLKENGWLVVDKGSYKNKKGEWQVPRFIATYPGLETNLPVENQPTDGGLEVNLRSRVENTPAVKSTLSVDTQLHPHPTVVNTNGGRLVDTAVPGGREAGNHPSNPDKPKETLRSTWERFWKGQGPEKDSEKETWRYLFNIYSTLNPDASDEAYIADLDALLKTRQEEDSDPVLFAHYIIWAATKSNYWGTPEYKQAHPALLAHYISKIDKIAAQYINYHSHVKKRPDEMAKTLVAILEWREKLAKV
jgi:hypothetical protein